MKKWNVRMDIIIAIIGVVGAFVVMGVVSMLDLNGFVTAAIVALALLIAVISVARVGAKESKPEDVAGK